MGCLDDDIRLVQKIGNSASHDGAEPVKRVKSFRCLRALYNVVAGFMFRCRTINSIAPFDATLIPQTLGGPVFTTSPAPDSRGCSKPDHKHHDSHPRDIVRNLRPARPLPTCHTSPWTVYKGRQEDSGEIREDNAKHDKKRAADQKACGSSFRERCGTCARDTYYSVMLFAFWRKQTLKHLDMVD